MSIDLSVHVKQGVRVDALAESITGVLRRVTGLQLVPRVSFRESRRDPADVPPDTKIGELTSIYVLCFDGREDQVLVTTVESERPTHSMVTEFSVGGTRDDTEYVLGLAGALGLATIADSDVEDEWSFWTTEPAAAPSVIMERLQLRTPATSFEDACTLVMANAGKGQ